jgi:LEA14-like dessication related protein
MNKKTTLFLGGAAILGYAAYKFWKMKESVDLFQYYPAGIKFSTEGLSLVITVQIDVYNPNRTSVPVKGVVGKLIFKGSTIGTFNNTEDITINALEKHRVELKVRVSAVGVIQAIATKDSKLTIAVQGMIKTPLVDVPLKFSQNLSAVIGGHDQVGFLSAAIFNQVRKRKKKKKQMNAEKRAQLLQRLRPGGSGGILSVFRNDAAVGFLGFGRRRKKKKTAAEAAAATDTAPMTQAQVMDWRNYRIFGPRKYQD